MKCWPIFSLLLLVQQSALQGQGLAAPGRSEQRGDEALADGLWEVAELHFREALAGPSLTQNAKSQIAIRLAESLIRAGNPSEALELLGQSFVVIHPESEFWKALALAGQRRFSEAAGILSTLLANPSAPHRTESGRTLASLQLALGQAEDALETLSKLIPDSEPAAAVKIQLYQAEILLDLKRTVAARQAMPESGTITPEDRPLAALLEAQLRLNEGHPADAEAGFQDLVNHPQGQSLTRHHSAAIGLADAIVAQGNRETAATSLLAFIQDHPDSPVLEAMFNRLLQWLPEKPAATDPTLERLAEWITPPILPATGPIAIISNTPSGAAAAWPTLSAKTGLSQLNAYSLYTRSVGLHRVATPESQAEYHRLLNRLLVEYPDHILTNQALYQSARWLLDAGSAEQAFSILGTLRDHAKSPALKGKAAFTEAYFAYLNGDPKQAIQLFEEAALSLAAPEARSARLQAAIARLRSGDGPGVALIQHTGKPPDPALEADLELERALSTTPPSAARPAIEEFLNRFPNHPRAPEARLAAVEAALVGPVSNLPFARAQLEILGSATNKSADIPAARLALARLRIADLAKDSSGAIAEAQSIIDTYPAAPAAAEAALTLGRNLFQTGSYNLARLVLEKLAASDSDHARSQAAWLLAGRAAALGGTPQSKDEALILFDKAIESKGPLSSIATLEKADHLIDLYRLAEASSFLTKWIRKLPEDDPLQLPAGLLLGVGSPGTELEFAL